MATSLPLLVFPLAKSIPPPKGKPVVIGQPHVPGRGKQAVRLGSQLTALQQEFDRYKASVSSSLAGLEPETVLVIEIAGSVNDFRQAVEAIGLEWLGEWDIDDIEPDEDFYENPKIGVDFFKNKIKGISNRTQSKEIRDILIAVGFIDANGEIISDVILDLELPAHLADLKSEIVQAINDAKKKSLSGRLFLSLGNENGMRELLSLWEQWRNNQTLPTGKTKWRDVFNQTVQIRRWGIEEALRETGMLDRWRDLLDPINPVQPIHCQIELFYRKLGERRAQGERNVTALLEAAGGRTLGSFIDMPEIGFHAVKARSIQHKGQGKGANHHDKRLADSLCDRKFHILMTVSVINFGKASRFCFLSTKGQYVFMTFDHLLRCGTDIPHRRLDLFRHLTEAATHNSHH